MKTVRAMALIGLLAVGGTALAQAPVFEPRFSPESEYDQIEVPVSTELRTSNCCEIRNTPGCDDPTCEAAVCAELPACCEVSWGDPVFGNADCTNLAIQLCGETCKYIVDGCDEPGTGRCCEENGSPFCDEDSTCCRSICLGTPGDPLDPPDSYCCLVEWDSLCAQQARGSDQCECQGQVESCCEVNFDAPGCDNFECMDCVCSFDSLCCTAAWFPWCVQFAQFECFDRCQCEPVIPPCPANDNDCCQQGGSGGCNNDTCCGTVCARDAYCCNTLWDNQCAILARDLCTDTCSCLTPFGDIDGDGQVTIGDFYEFTQCMTGPDAYLPVGCRCFDDNQDGEVDLSDFKRFQDNFNE